MTDQRQGVAPTDLRLDGIGRLETLGVFVYLTAAFGMTAIPFIADIRNEASYSATSWWVGLATGSIVGIAAAAGLRWAWRRRGGRRLMRLADRSLRTGRLPESLALRAALLREFERRDKSLNKQVPAIVTGVLWTVVLVLRVTSDHSLFNVLSALLVWGFFAGATALNVSERRRWPRLRRLSAELRLQPSEHPTAADAPQPSSTTT